LLELNLKTAAYDGNANNRQGRSVAEEEIPVEMKTVAMEAHCLLD
jgi:hypothetical protein